MSLTLQDNFSVTDLINGDLQLASPPNIYFALKKIAADPTKSLIDAAFVIEQDPALSLKLLQIVNSAFYGFTAKISSISQAISLIGMQELQNIILSTAVMDKFSDLPGGLISMNNFWEKSLRCALISREIDLLLGKDYAESIFVCGILHHIGELVFCLRIPELTRDISLQQQAIAEATDNDRINIEESLLGFNHFIAGAALIQRWKLPDLISDSIKLHTSQNTQEAHHKIASIIQLADFYAKKEAVFDETINNLGLSETTINTIIQTSDEKFTEIFKLFYNG